MKICITLLSTWINFKISTGNTETFPVSLKVIYQTVVKSSIEQLHFHSLFLCPATS